MLFVEANGETLLERNLCSMLHKECVSEVKCDVHLPLEESCTVLHYIQISEI